LVNDAFREGAPDLHRAVAQALGMIQGTWAICVVHDDYPGEIVAGSHLAPLLVGIGENEMLVASDVVAVLAHTRRVVDLEDGETVRVTASGFELYDRAAQKIERASRWIDWSPIAAEKEGFKHFMLKEIHEQPRVISDGLSGRLLHDDADVNLDGIEIDWSSIRRIVMLACGTSWHAALCGKHHLEHLARVWVEVDYASEFRYRDPIAGPDDLAIVISQSGETADTLAALREAKARGAKTLAVCNVVGSTIARTADMVLYTHAGPEVSVASTKAFTSQLTVLTLL